ncbi:MAG: 4a-hydroxytetrahydrobiopterin dehydratase [Candidatus Omnitrophica bacterium]|nr:4a-hydroxytetrahydrobiopterin dehydratase [Candidatus Omnitrophota bacterium]
MMTRIKRNKISGRKVKLISPLIAEHAQESLKGIPGWSMSSNGQSIFRDFVLKDFMSAIHLIGHIALIAEEKDHHPDVHLTNYRQLRVELSTHTAGGLTGNDFIEAELINKLPMELKGK